MRARFIFWILCLPAALSVNAEPWVQISVDEIEAASPIRALAVMPVRLATAAYNALPKRYYEDAREWGFDIQQISRDIEKLPVGGKTSIVRDTMQVHVSKFEKKESEPPPANPSYLVVKINDTTVSCPLLLTSAAVKVLTYLFEELQPVREELKIVIQNVKMVPPGRLLWCTDQYETLEISLK